MADFTSQLNGTQMDTALMGVARHDPEAWAVGQRNGQNVSSADETYENNAKYYAESAYESAARASGSIPSGTAGAVFFDRAQSLTDAQKAQARENIAAANSNRNLLDNPFFTVNQRNASGTIAQGGYPADRWINENTGSCTRNNDGTISVNGSSNYVLFRQKQTADYMSALVGKTVTFSYLTSGGSIVAKTMTIAASTQNIAYISANGYMCVDTRSNANSTFILFRDSQTIRAVKLELGSYSTLINDTPPDYGEELRKCRRYFRRYAPNQTGLALIGRAGSATEADFILGDEPMAKSTGITAAINGAVYARAGDNTNHSVTSATVQTSIGGGPALICTTSGLTAYATAVIVFASGGYIDILGDL